MFHLASINSLACRPVLVPSSCLSACGCPTLPQLYKFPPCFKAFASLSSATPPALYPPFFQFPPLFPGSLSWTTVTLFFLFFFFFFSIIIIHGTATTTANTFSRSGRGGSHAHRLFERNRITVRSASSFERWRRFKGSHPCNRGRCCRRRGACRLARDHMAPLGSLDPAHRTGTTQGSGTFFVDILFGPPSSPYSIRLSVYFFFRNVYVKGSLTVSYSKICSKCAKTLGGMRRQGSDRNRSTDPCSSSIEKAAG